MSVAVDKHKSSLILSAPVAEVYEALTTQRGIAAWWTATCEVGTRVGESITVRFGDTFKTMRIESLKPASEVVWRVIEARLLVPGLTRTDEWIGTTIAFKLDSPSARSTRLDLEHVGLTRNLECYDLCSQGWDQFLKSLENYVVSGVGAPFAPMEA